jgi:DNA-binding transcriptional MocR family regulator
VDDQVRKPYRAREPLVESAQHTRLFVADKAQDQGRGGISRLSELTGMSRTTITKALGELNSRKKLVVAERGQIREAGGGRKKAEEADPELPVRLGKILEETSAGDPMSALRWTNKSTEAIADELTRQIRSGKGTGAEDHPAPQFRVVNPLLNVR